ncbi:MAG: hypothetical protein WA162_04025 [Thermodesulfobacteriota bacterium]
MRISSFKYVFIATAFLMAGCGVVRETQKAGQAAIKYPEADYLTATGAAVSEEGARNAALAELSRIFESKIKSDTLDRVRYASEGGSEKFKAEIESEVNVATAVDLEGVSIGSEWYDDAKKTYYAVAALPRAEARNKWQKDIGNIDAEIQAELDSAESQESVLFKLRSFNTARSLWVRREVLVSRLRVIGSPPPSSPYDMKNVLNSTARIKSEMLIYVGISGNSSIDAATTLSAALSGKGYSLTPTRSKADAVVEGVAEVSGVDVSNPPWKYARASISISMKDLKSGAIAAEVKTDKRAGHMSFEEAGHKAMKEASLRASETLLEFFEQGPRP